MAKKVSVLSAKKDADRAAEAVAVKIQQFITDRATQDSFQNFSAKLGLGTDNISSGSTYGLNPITRIPQLLEWIHRGSWLGGVAIDLKANDMTRNGISINAKIDDDDNKKIQAEIQRLQVWNKVCSVIKWGRLYGGAIGAVLIDGQDMATPLRLDRIGPGQFRGLISLDRWMVEPSLEDLVTDLGPSLGMPKYYRIMENAPALRGVRVHHSRIFRVEGIELPYRQRLMESLWGESVIERIYDRLTSFDAATTGASQLVYKSYVRTYGIDGLRSVVAQGGDALNGLVKYVQMMAKFQSIEGVTLIDSKDTVQAETHQAFSGLSDALVQFGQQLSGALQIPLVRLFGQSPSGMNATGESDLRMYYDGIKQEQETVLLDPMTKIVILAARSAEIKLPDTFSVEFVPLYDLNDTEKSEIAGKDAESIGTLFDRGIIGAETALMELSRSGETTGRFTTITEDDIKKAKEADLAPDPSEMDLADPASLANDDKEVAKADEAETAESDKPSAKAAE